MSQFGVAKMGDLMKVSKLSIVVAVMFTVVLSAAAQLEKPVLQ